MIARFAHPFIQGECSQIERPNGMKLARHYQAHLDTGKFESRAALANFLGVSRARVTQVLKRLRLPSTSDSKLGTDSAEKTITG